MRGLIFGIGWSGLAGALLFPVWRQVIYSPAPERLRFAVWMAAAGVAVFGAALTIRSPRRVQSWVCAVMLWLNALMLILLLLRWR